MMTIYDEYLKQVDNLEGETPETITWTNPDGEEIEFEIVCSGKNYRHYVSAKRITPLTAKDLEIFGGYVDIEIMLEVRNAFGTVIWTYSSDLFEEV